VASFIEIPPLSAEILCDTKQVLTNGWTMIGQTAGRMYDWKIYCSAPTIVGKGIMTVTKHKQV